jgi:hypothetical protein
MLLFPLAFSLVTAIVVFAGVSYVFNFYRGRYDQAEINAASVISGGTLLFLVTIFYGRYIFTGNAGEFILGCVLTVIVTLAFVATCKVLRADKPQPGSRN